MRNKKKEKKAIIILALQYASGALPSLHISGCALALLLLTFIPSNRASSAMYYTHIPCEQHHLVFVSSTLSRITLLEGPYGCLSNHSVQLTTSSLL